MADTFSEQRWKSLTRPCGVQQIYILFSNKILAFIKPNGIYGKTLKMSKHNTTKIVYLSFSRVHNESR